MDIISNIIIYKFAHDKILILWRRRYFNNERGNSNCEYNDIKPTELVLPH